MIQNEKTNNDVTINETKLKLMGLITELEREMRIIENKIEEIKTIIYHL